jgi:Arc/MetJ-type ribon-helix-helix transcriptional regulator
MNIDLGATYEAAIMSIIEKGYAESQTEIVRQSVLAYERMIEEEELVMVHKAVEIEMKDIESRECKTYSLDDIKKSVMV